MDDVYWNVFRYVVFDTPDPRYIVENAVCEVTYTYTYTHTYTHNTHIHIYAHIHIYTCE